MKPKPLAFKASNSLLVLAACMLMTASCKKNDSTSDIPAEVSGLDGLLKMTPPTNFNYNTDRDVDIDVTLMAPDGTALKNVMVTLLDKPEDQGGQPFYTSVTDAAGKISGVVKIPAYVTEITVDPSYVGVMRNATVKIVSNTILCSLGGQTVFGGNVVPTLRTANTQSSDESHRTMAIPYKYLGTYSGAGRPNYLVTPNDVVTTQLLTYINASLPESRPVPTYHPDYLKQTAETNINLTALADVWFTFVHEGAGWTNSIAYYTYPTGHAPSTEADIDTLRIILPNASLSGSGGGLVSGNKVNLGRFPAGTSIGFCLLANAWNGSSVGSGSYKAYSNDNLNPEATATLRRHSVLLYDNAESLFLVGFEDTRRDASSCDQDFNDCIFYVKSNPVTAISQAGVNPIDVPVDTDRDGVNDTYDKFPTDPTRAYINYYPSENVWGTLAFEDNWPNLGDYDVNDLVMGYRYKLINNAQNKTVEMYADYTIKAAGANFRNGFGVEFPFPSSNVQAVTGTRVNNSQVVTLGANGCETGQTKAVIIAFDDAFSVMSNANGFINTLKANAWQKPDTTKMKISFTTPLTAAAIGTVPFNPFVIINKTRGREVHLAGKTPTQKANTALFGTGKDHTVPGQNIYYKTTTGLPFGIGFSENFEYPVEYAPINDAFSKFAAWTLSSGAANANWYKDSSNMVTTKIYRK